MRVFVRMCVCVRVRVLPGEHRPAAPGEGVWVLLPEDVAHPTAGDDLQAAAALPHSERDLWSPNQHKETVRYFKRT